ncbi:MAG: transposase, partial [Deltaproteobacteria bacterium]
MKLTAQIKLIISQKDKESLLETMEQFNEVCNGISKSAFEYKVFRQYEIHQMLYHPIRGCFDLSAQLVVRAISKVADSYKLDTKKPRKFREHGAITYDSRILTWKDEEVSIWALGGRKKFSYVCGKRQKEQIKFQKG